MAEDAVSRPSNNMHSGEDMLAVLAAVDNDNGGLESATSAHTCVRMRVATNGT